MKEKLEKLGLSLEGSEYIGHDEAVLKFTFINKKYGDSYIEVSYTYESDGDDWVESYGGIAELHCTVPEYESEMQDITLALEDDDELLDELLMQYKEDIINAYNDYADDDEDSDDEDEEDEDDEDEDE